MSFTLRGILAAWLVLLALLLAALGMLWLAPSRIAPGLILIGFIAMIVVVGFALMRLGSASVLAKAFVVAAVFWLLVLIGLGSMDPLTRTDYPVRVTRYP
jgi:hypothetical protein